MKSNVIGIASFALICVVLGLLTQIAADLLGAQTPLPSQIGTFLVAVPLALLAARHVGRVTHLSILVASVVIALGTLWATVVILNAVAQPAGGHVGWRILFNAMNLRNTLLGTAAMLISPQIWLWLLNRVAANNSSKPTPLRGAA